MNNYQLYRTNVLLGGQMKYDLILNSTGDNTNIIDEIHITPISDCAPYDKYIKDNLLNYSHQENIKGFYKKMSGSFYDDFVNPLLDNPFPLPDDYVGENYDSTYEMGCRRKNYQLYKKQFEFFCPVWLEQISDLSKLKFQIKINTTNDLKKYQAPLEIIKIIKFSKDGEVSKLEKYFNDYIKFIKLDKGKDWVFDINKTCSIISGLNVETGIYSDIELNRFYEDLIYRERPLLEFNNMIISELNKNKLIVPQLFNFNICFNLEDLLSDFVINNLYDYPIHINVDVLLNDEVLERADIFSNHEFIPKRSLSSDTYSQKIERSGTLEKFKIDNSENLTSFNVLDYLRDNRCIDIIDKNKIIQNTCHWCNSLEPTYHFNVYDGFNIIFRKYTDKATNKFEYINIPYYDEATTNMKDDINEDSEDSYQYPYWCNNYILEEYLKGENGKQELNNIKSLISEILNSTYNHDYLYSTFSSNCIVKNINYKTRESIKPIKVVLLQIKTDPSWELDEWNNWKDSEYKGINWKYSQIENCYILYNEVDRKIIFITKYDLVKNLTYKSMLSKLSNSEIRIIQDLYEILSNPNLFGLDMIKFSNGLAYSRANSPSINSQEIEYHKAKSNKSIVRLMGKIKPYFIRVDDMYKNYQYSKIRYNDTNHDYKLYSQSIYEPKYPSLNYTSLRCNYINYDKDSNDKLESNHYSANKVIYLLPYIEFEKEIDSDDIVNENTIIEECILHHYSYLKSVSANQKDKISYIINKYEIVRFSVDVNENGKYIYNIQIRLK